MNIKLCVDVRLGGTVGVGHGHHASHVLEVGVALHPDLAQTTVGVSDLEYTRVAGRRQLSTTQHQHITTTLYYSFLVYGIEL